MHNKISITKIPDLSHISKQSQNVSTDVESIVGQLYNPHFDRRLSRPEEKQEFELKYFICCDWLEFTVRGITINPLDEQPPDNVQLTNGVELVYAGTQAGKWYKYKYLIYLKDRKEPFGEILTVGSTKAMRLNSQIRVFNNQLYRENWARNDLKRVIKALGVEVLHVTRLDIALDSNQNFIELYKAWDKGLISKVGRKMKIPAPDKDSNGEITKFNWGSLQSNKSAKGYRKGEDIDRSNKEYIRENWRKNELIESEDSGKHIQRFELTLKAKECKKIYRPHDPEKLGVDIYQLEEPGYLAGIMEAQIKGWFEFAIPNPSDKNKSRWDRIGAIDFAAIGAMKIFKLASTKTASASWRAKRATTKIFEDIANEDYLTDAVADYLESNVELTLTDKELKKARKRLHGYMNTYFNANTPLSVVSGIVKVVTDDFKARISAKIPRDKAKGLLSEIAFSMAEYHKIDGWLFNRLSDPKFGFIKPVFSPLAKGKYLPAKVS